tara:strand:+ start:61 stop:414 length:354 start_codon:yes stop_codon:yes gene_type:complete
MNIKFNYNRIDAKCDFCNRTKNPHPYFDEPLVTQFFKTANNRNVEICINCYGDIQDVIKKNKHTFERVIDNKQNLTRLFNKINLKANFNKTNKNFDKMEARRKSTHKMGESKFTNGN